MNTTQKPRTLIVPVLFPLPVHHGIMVFGLTIVGLIAATIIYEMFFSPDARREVF
jgi:hypothetical protein